MSILSLSWFLVSFAEPKQELDQQKMNLFLTCIINCFRRGEYYLFASL